MNKQQEEKMRMMMKTVSSAAFDKFIVRQLGAPDVDKEFIGMLTDSEYFRDLFYEGFIEGSHFMMKIGEKQ